MTGLTKKKASFYIINAFSEIGDNNSYDADPFK